MSAYIISIIVPVYNAEKYIVDSLNSIISQITPEVEVVIVDDGSTDNSLNLIKQYFQTHIQSNHLKLYTQKNKGVSAARNLGITNAKGQYIGFMDADDLVLEDYVTTLLKATLSNADIIEFGYRNFVYSIHEALKSQSKYSNIIFGMHSVSDVADHVYSKARWYPWTRIFKQTLFTEALFPIGVKFCEDLMTIPKLYEKANTILVLENVIYGYRANADGATCTVQEGYIEKLITFYSEIPQSDLLRHAYLKASVAYAIFSCQEKLKHVWRLPQHIQSDLNQLPKKLAIYSNIGLRRSLILFYPNLFKLLRRLGQK